MKNNNSKIIITLPLKKILEDFDIRRQSFYAINSKYKIFKKEAFGTYSTKMVVYQEIKNFYKAKSKTKRRGLCSWKHE